MLAWLAALQPLLVGGVLLWAGAFKLLGPRAGQLARRSALSTLVGRDRAHPAYRIVGWCELAVGAVLVLPPAPAAEAWLAAVLWIVMLGYLAYARVAAPESSCGCLSARHTPVRWRSFARAGALLATSVLAAAGSGWLGTASPGWLGVAGPGDAPGWWAGAVVDRPVSALVVLVVEAALVVVLSPELDARWLVPLRRARVRLRHPLAGTHAGFDIPVESSVHQLLRSPAYRAAGGWVRSDLLDHWDEGDWRILSYTARLDGRTSTAVFAVPRLRYDPAAVRAAIVDGDTVLWSHDPSPVPA